jgi:hypothetical protein
MREGARNRPMGRKPIGERRALRRRRLAWLTALGGATVVGVTGACGCSTVEPGNDPQIAQVVYDPDFFYCEVLPKVLVAKSCSSGDPSLDMGGCHTSVAHYQVLPLAADEMVACDANGKHTGNISQPAESNYGSAEAEMSPNAESAPLLTHPTQKTTHPRQIFDASSMEAEIIRQWAQHSSR